MLKPLALLLIALSLLVPSAASAAQRTLTGAALYRERIALPPTARFEAAIVDTARADASARLLAQTTIDNPGQPPIAFAIAYDDAALDPRARYSLRATISVDGRLWFTTDTMIPVLRAGAPDRVKLLLRRVGARQGVLGPPPGDALIGGEFRYFADAAAFTPCRTLQEIPVALEGGYTALELAYRGARSEPGAKLYATVEGRVESREGMEGPPRPTLVVTRFVGVWPGENCERNRADAGLANSYWKIETLGGETMTPVEGRREGSLVLHEPGFRAAATVGCNRMVASWRSEGRGALAFGRFASTMMACPPPLDARERALADILARTRAFAIAGPILELYDETHAPLAVFRSVALR